MAIDRDPRRLGSGISTSTTATLALLDPSGMQPGTAVYCLETQTFWVLTITNGPPVGVEVFGTVGSRWIERDAAVGVTSIIAGDGISVDASTGDVTVTNTGLLSAGAGAGISVSIVDGVATITNTSSTPPSADWDATIDRIYAVDEVGGDDSRLGYADPSSSSSIDYEAACDAAMAVAKKTWTGLAAVFPRFGNGRGVEIEAAAGTYSDSPADVVNGSSGYVRCLVRGVKQGLVTGNGSVDALQDSGAVLATGMAAGGYNVTAAFSGITYNMRTDSGHADPGFSVMPAIPAGWRLRWRISTATSALRGVARHIADISAGSTDQLVLQTLISPDPDIADICDLQMAGVVVPAMSLNISDSITFVGIRCSGDVDTVGPGIPTFVFCGCQSFTGSSVLTAQSYIHRIQASIVVGGGLRTVGSATFVGGTPVLYGLTTTVETTLDACSGDFQVGVGCSSRNYRFIGVSGGSGVTSLQNPNYGAGSAPGAQPRTWGDSGTSANLLESSVLRVDGIRGRLATAPVIRLQGKNTLFMGSWVGAPNGPSVGLDLRYAGQSLIQIDSASSKPSGDAGDILCGGGAAGLGPFMDWGKLGTQDFWDTQGNHLVELALPPTAAGPTISPSVEAVELSIPGDHTWCGIERVADDHTLFYPAQADTPAHATGVVGILLSDPNRFAIIGGSSGYCALQFQGTAPTLGDVVYLCTSVKGMAQVDVPAMSATNQKLRLGIVVGGGGGGRAIVRMNPELIPVTADGNP